MQAFALILALVLGIVELVIAVPLVLLPMKAADQGAPGCARLFPPIALVPMALINSGLYLFLRCEGSFLQKFGLCFGGTTIFAAAMLYLSFRTSPLFGRPPLAFRLVVGAGFLAVFWLLVLLATPGPAPVLTIEPGLALLLAVIGFPAALVVLSIVSRMGQARSSFSMGQVGEVPKRTGEVTYLPPPER